MNEKSCEVRVGLVMYGGVSLAVYINGVAQEFFRAVHGRGIYRVMKTLTDSDIVVDILSGSSAGGINGILLSYSLCNNKDFSQCSKLWRDVADVRKLLRSPFKDNDAPKSVMDSEVYYQQGVEDAFRTMRTYSASSDETPSTVNELDLFVTGTDMDGRVSTQLDDAGHVIEIKNHRTVFHLKYREDRKNPFDTKKNPAAVVALSKLARITSCFPGAFAPVCVDDADVDGKNPDTMTSDELLHYWGAINRKTYFIDGGVLDNKPFTHTIREIFFRTADKKVDRKLYYVEPDPERFGEIQVRQPNFLKPIVDSLVSIPGYESIADDLKLLNERNTHIRQYQRLLKTIDSRQKTTRTNLYDAAPSVEPPAGLSEPSRSIYERSRLASISDRALRGVFRKSSTDDALNDSEKDAAQKLVKRFDDWRGAAAQTLVDFDVYYRLRRLFHVVYSVYDALYAEEKSKPTDAQQVVYRVLWQALNRHIKLLEIITSAMERVIDESRLDWAGKQPEDVWLAIRGRFERVLSHEEVVPDFPMHLDSSWHVLWLNQDALRSVHRRLNELVDEVVENESELPVSESFRSILLAADDREHHLFHALFTDPADPIYRAYYEFIDADAHLFPLEYISGLKEKDIIETVRMSPLDAQRAFSNKKSADKVTGDSLAHFSAFFKRSWRSNDIMWGRLDATCQLVETLLTETRLREVLPNKYLRESIHNEFFPNGTTTLVERLFPHGGARTHQDLNTWLHLLTSEKWERALENFAMMQDLLIEVAQFEIIHEELPEVHFDALREQADWDPVNNSKDSLLLAGTTEDEVRKWFQELTADNREYSRPTQSRLGRYFEKYQVGKESLLKDIPPLILLDTLSRTLLVVRNCVLGVFDGQNVDRIKSNQFYLWAVDIPLKTFYGIVVFLRTAPSFQITVQAALTTVSLLAILVGVFWRNEIIEPAGRLNLLWFAVFLAIPTMVLCVQALFFSRTRIRDRRFSPNLQTAIVGVCAATPLVLVVAFWMGLLDAGRELIVNTLGNLGITLRPGVVTFLMYSLYVIAPLVLPIIGGWGMTALQRRPRITRDQVVFELECLQIFQLRELALKLDLGPAVCGSPERIEIVDGILKKIKQERDWGRLRECIRKVNPDAFN